MLDTFSQAREVDIVEAARYFGLEVNRYGKALCPFHNDHHPSLSCKYNRFHCFACGASGSAIDLVAQLTGTSPREAVDKIISVFHLNIIPTESSYKQDKELVRRFEDWIQAERRRLAAEHRTLLHTMKLKEPKTPDDIPSECVEACQKIDQIGYELDILIHGSFEQKVQYWRNHERTGRTTEGGGLWMGAPHSL